MKRISWALLLVFGQLWGGEPLAVYLTWRGDPTTTMVVQWLIEEGPPDTTLHYCRVGGGEMRKVVGKSLSLRGGVASLQRVELTDLTPDSDYLFFIGEAKTKSCKGYSFHTLPSVLTGPLRFAVGGDAYGKYERFRKMNAAVASQNPCFVVLGGDIAYAHGGLSLGRDWRRWRTFFITWAEQMKDQKGRMIPLVPVVGNHDVKGGLLGIADNPKRSLFYDLFLFCEERGAYRVLNLGDYCSLFLLDSGHTHGVEGNQTKWLKEELEGLKAIPYKMAVYHVPAYPGLNNFDYHLSKRIRRAWVPLFEEGGVQAAFEHHNHVYKRTLRLREGKEDSAGILYLGDGSWGTSLRRLPALSDQPWYIAKAKAVNMAFIVDLDASQCAIRAMDNTGRFFDEATLQPINNNQ